MAIVLPPPPLNNPQDGYAWQQWYNQLTLLLTAVGLADTVLGLSSSGLVVRTGTDAYTSRQIVGTSGRVDVTNGTGISGNPTLTVPIQMSITSDASGLKLINDETSPGNSEYYGTNGVGTKGFYPLPTVFTQNSQSADYTTVLGDANNQIFHPDTDNNPRTFTIASNASVAYTIGTILTFINRINTLTIAINTDTLIFAGSGATGSRTLAANGIARAHKITSTSWLIEGTGLT